MTTLTSTNVCKCWDGGTDGDGDRDKGVREQSGRDPGPEEAAAGEPGERHGMPRVQARCRAGACIPRSSARCPDMARRRSAHGASTGVHRRAAVAQEPPAAKMARVETAAPATSNTAKAATPAKAAAPPAKKEEKKEFSWEKKKPDPKDFMFSNLKGQVGDSAAGA